MKQLQRKIVGLNDYAQVRTYEHCLRNKLINITTIAFLSGSAFGIISYHLYHQSTVQESLLKGRYEGQLDLLMIQTYEENYPSYRSMVLPEVTDSQMRMAFFENTIGIRDDSSVTSDLELIAEEGRKWEKIIKNKVMLNEYDKRMNK